MIVYGPYRRKDGRQVVIHYDGKTRRTQSYPRYLMEQFLGRKLESWEQVDHINNDPTDDRLENFQLLTQAENIRKGAKPAEIYQFICPICFKWSEKSAAVVRANRKRGSSGPYCSRSCAGKAGMAE
jgi:HNH endonuclease